MISLTTVALLAVIALIALPAPEEQSEEAPPVTCPTAAALISDAWVADFSLRAYRPMLRLARQDDGHYLDSTPARGKRYRRVQHRLLREYLSSLARDFHQLYTIAVEKSRRAAGESEAPMALVEQRIAFILLMWSIEIRLMLRTVIPHSINLEPLLASVESLAEENREMVRARLQYGLR